MSSRGCCSSSSSSWLHSHYSSAEYLSSRVDVTSIQTIMIVALYWHVGSEILDGGVDVSANEILPHQIEYILDGGGRPACCDRRAMLVLRICCIRRENRAPRKRTRISVWLMALFVPNHTNFL